ncbi:MAG: transposase [Deltaproteobacteria bacterium]|jgi:REP element-mobilizing transposase RayT|nr:transposase [Deltaproteobacteria bacterium]
MSRPWRIEYEGALYHLLSRGNQRSDIFINDKDRTSFLDAVGEMSERYDIDIFAYVLMDNHYHLLARARQANLKQAMQWFGTTYTQRFNRRHFRSGHLFQGRSKSIIIQNDAYLLQLSDYIHRNPLRAGIVRRLTGYRWTSYNAYAYGRDAPKWLSTDLILDQFAGKQDRHRSYRKKVQKYASEEKHLLEDLRHGLILGSKQFVEKIRKKYAGEKPDAALPQQRQIANSFDSKSYLRRGERIFGCDLEHFVNAKRLSGTEKEIRDLLLYGIWKTGQFKNEKIGGLFGLSYSGVSHAVKSAKLQLAKSRQLQTKFDQLNSLFKL